MKRFLSWDRTEPFCPIEASTPPSLHQLFNSGTTGLGSFTSSTETARIVTATNCRSASSTNDAALSIINNPPTAAVVSHQQIILDQLSKLASQGNLNPVESATDTVSAATLLSAAVNQQQQQERQQQQETINRQQEQQNLEKILSALTTSTLRNPSNNLQANIQQQCSEQWSSLPNLPVFKNAGVTEPTASVLTQQSLSSRLNVAATAQTSAISPGNVANTFGTSLNLNSFDQSHSQQLLSNQQHTYAQLLDAMVNPQNISATLSTVNNLIQQNTSNMNMLQQGSNPNAAFSESLLNFVTNKPQMNPPSQPSNCLQAALSTMGTPSNSLLNFLGGEVAKTEAHKPQVISAQQQNAMADMISQQQTQQRLAQQMLEQQLTRQNLIQQQQQQQAKSSALIEQLVQQQQQNLQLSQKNSPNPLQVSNLNISDLNMNPAFFGLCSNLRPLQQETTQTTHQQNSKPIPMNTKMDLESFKKKEPREWTYDDVLMWILSCARKNEIPRENFNLFGFAKCDGRHLMVMTEQNFKECDMSNGSLLFNEFKQLNNESLKLKSLQVQTQQQASTSFTGSHTASPGNLWFAAASQLVNEQIVSHRHQSDLLSPVGQSRISAEFLQQQVQQQHSHVNVNLLTPILQQSYNTQKPQTSANSRRELKVGPSCSKAVKKGFDPMKIRKNKDGRPRKRSQHTKGNKLWEFIRDALKNPNYCPSIVRWEDREEGVFRIVESEKLATLWGQKKNNVKMTYEKLSRAMRTYYEKEILVPVPKCGLYPKKLVYKFGPSAHGWRLQQPIQIQNPTHQFQNIGFTIPNALDPIEVNVTI